MPSGDGRNSVGRIILLTLGLTWSAGCQPEAPTSGDAALRDGSWRTDAIWDDGRAEFSAYTVAWSRYGHSRSGRALLIVVKEPWAPELAVKADRPRPDGFDVLKLNHVRDVRTGIYDYHQMASAFIHRANGRLVKFTTMSAEACGLSTANLLNGRLTTHSYFDGQGDREVIVPSVAIPEDALPLALRDFVRVARVPESLSLLPSLLVGRFPELTVAAEPLQRGEPKPFEAFDGNRVAVTITVGTSARARSYTFDVRPPHVLLEHTDSGGTRYVLAKSERLAYWDRNAPGDEAWWPESLR